MFIINTVLGFISIYTFKALKTKEAPINFLKKNRNELVLSLVLSIVLSIAIQINKTAVDYIIGEEYSKLSVFIYFLVGFAPAYFIVKFKSLTGDDKAQTSSHDR